MGLKRWFLRRAGQLYFERPARKRSLAEHIEGLRASGERLEARLAGMRATDVHREKLRHVIGIERWGQRRLRVLLGEPLELDAHHPYKPPPEDSWGDLLSDFGAARAETLRIAEALVGLDGDERVPHNDFGELSARGWLRYLRGHAEVETRRLR